MRKKWIKEYEDNLDKFIDTRKKIKENKIKKKLKEFISLYKRFCGLDFSKAINVLPKESGEPKKDYIQRLFKEKPLFIIKELIYDVGSYEYAEKVHLQTMRSKNNIAKSGVLYMIHKVKLNDVKYLIDIENLEYQVQSEFEEFNSKMECSINIEYINYFSAEIILGIECIILEGYLDEIINYNSLILSINYVGLKYDNTLPIWIEEIIEGAIYQEDENEKLSNFKYFVAFDNFVQECYNSISEFSEIDIGDVKHEIDYHIKFLENECWDKYESMSDYKFNHLIEKLTTLYTQNYEEIEKFYLHEFSESFKIFTKQKRYLINEKLKDVRNFLEIDQNKSEFSGLSQLLPEIKKIEKYRNSVAHGTEIKVELKNKTFYTIMTYILSLIFCNDFHRTKWERLIDYRK